MFNFIINCMIKYCFIMGNDVVGCMVLWVCKEVNLVSYSIDVY